MDSEAAKWFLSTIAQVMAALLGLLFIGFVFWYENFKRKKITTQKELVLTIIIYFLFSISIVMGFIVLYDIAQVLLRLPYNLELENGIRESVNENASAFRFWLCLTLATVLLILWDIYRSDPRITNRIRGVEHSEQVEDSLSEREIDEGR